MADSILQMLGIRPADVNLLRDRGVPLDQPMPYDPSYQVPGTPPAQRVGDVAGGALSALPSVGDAYSVLQAIADLEAGNYGDAAWNGVAALPMVVGMGAIKAFHGSPHKFDAFDMSKVGTGEGAQVRGHGLYFAESPETAEFYRRMNDYGQGWTPVDNKQGRKAIAALAKQGNEPAGYLHQFAKEYPDEDINVLADEYYGSEFGYTDLENQQATEDMLIKAGLRKPVDTGSLYEASLEWPDPAREASDPLGPQHFLDWDKPINEHPEGVLKALEEAGINSMSGANAGPMAREQEMYLAKHGIPGIRYLDQGSRGAGDGTYNYVVFDDKIPKIVSRK
jgi:hypothetical protein